MLVSLLLLPQCAGLRKSLGDDLDYTQPLPMAFALSTTQSEIHRFFLEGDAAFAINKSRTNNPAENLFPVRVPLT